MPQSIIALTPTLLAANSDAEKAALQNALVYELYGLTAEEIALVEGSGK